MSCGTTSKDNRFVITRGVENTFVFTVKANSSTLPMEIDAGDTFVGILRDIATDVVVLTKNLTVESALNGTVRLVLTAMETSSMVRERGPKEDRFYLSPVYSLTLVCNTLVNGDFLAKVNWVYVD
jgi:hypothetical protein